MLCVPYMECGNQIPTSAEKEFLQIAALAAYQKIAITITFEMWGIALAFRMLCMRRALPSPKCFAAQSKSQTAGQLVDYCMQASRRQCILTLEALFDAATVSEGGKELLSTALGYLQQSE
jgi:hypothetical protein